MPYRTHFDVDVNCIFVEHYDVYEEGEEIDFMQIRLGFPKHQKHINILRDVSSVALPDSYDLDWFRNNVKTAIAPYEEDFGSGRKVAWVLNNPHDYMIIHQWCTIGRLNLKVAERKPFREIGPAMKWLGLPDDYEITYPE